MDFPKIWNPLAIVIGCLVLAVSFYLVQIDKRKSIERQYEQQRVVEQKELEYEQKLQDLENERLKLKVYQDNCRSLSSGVKDEWNNVLGVVYSEYWNECVVTFVDPDTGNTKTAPLSRFGDAD